MKTEQTKLEEFNKSFTIKYSRPVEQIGIAWTYGGLEDLQRLLDEPIAKIFFDAQIVERMEHHPNKSGMGGKIVFFYNLPIEDELIKIIEEAEPDLFHCNRCGGVFSSAYFEEQGGVVDDDDENICNNCYKS